MNKRRYNLLINLFLETPSLFLVLLLIVLCYLVYYIIYYIFSDPIDVLQEDTNSQVATEANQSNELHSTGRSYFPDPVLYQLLGSTNYYGVVDEDSFSELTKAFLTENELSKIIYRDFRVRVWENFREERTRDNYDAFWYDPEHSPFLIEIESKANQAQNGESCQETPRSDNE